MIQGIFVMVLRLINTILYYFIIRNINEPTLIVYKSEKSNILSYLLGAFLIN